MRVAPVADGVTILSSNAICVAMMRPTVPVQRLAWRVVRERLDVKARDRPDRDVAEPRGQVAGPGGLVGLPRSGLDLVGADLAPRRVHLRQGRTAGRRGGEPTSGGSFACARPPTAARRSTAQRCDPRRSRRGPSPSPGTGSDASSRSQLLLLIDHRELAPELAPRAAPLLALGARVGSSVSCSWARALLLMTTTRGAFVSRIRSRLDVGGRGNRSREVAVVADRA